MSGVWKDLTDNVNSMASNLTNQVRNIAEVTTAVARGDLSRKITVDVRGEILLLKETINTMVDQLNGFAAEVTRVAREVGTEGKLGGQATVTGVAGTWKDLTDSVNAMATNLTGQVRNIAEVTTAVARGDLSRKITVEVRGEILQLKETINTMVDQLNSFAAEVTRVAREVGTEGKLGGQANVRDVSGVWKELTENVNVMANNLTEQVRGIVKVVTAVANGDLRQRLTVESKGEVAALGETINSMTGTLAIFADQVTSVAREVGVEGRLGGQAHVAGASGTWKDLVANVNMLAANLTTQVRAIAEVATAVTKGDLTRSIQVEARGEVSELKDNINAMIHNLRHTTERNTEQDWLKTNLAKFSRMMQGQRDLVTLGETLLAEFAPLVNAHQGVIYIVDYEDGQRYLKQLASYADVRESAEPRRYRFGEGFVGECAVQRQRLLLARIPQDSDPPRAAGWWKRSRATSSCCRCCTKARSRRSSSWPRCTNSPRSHLAFLEQLTGSIGVVLNTIEATMRTEGLLKQSQELAGELQTQQVELQQTNEEMATKARLLAEQNAEVERKNQEIEQARKALEEKAAELALTSRYKTEFLANMSHELRTPLNSILILGQQLSENPESNLSARQVEFAKTIHAAGTDLLNLISDILDLSKIESGTVTVESEELAFSQLRETIERNFRHEAESRHLTFTTDFDPRLGRTHGHRREAPHADRQEPAVECHEVHGAGQRAPARGPGDARLDAPITRCCRRPRAWSSSRSRIPASASRPRSRRSSSRRSSRRMPAPRASTAAPAWGSPSAASSRTCSAARSASRARRARAARSRSIYRSPTRARPMAAATTPTFIKQPSRRAAGAGVAGAAHRARRRRSRGDRGRRQYGAHRRGRAALRADAARGGARQGLQGAGGAERRGCAVAGAQVPARAPSRSTCSCPTCWAGRCSISSSTTRPRATSPCRCSPWKRSASTASSAARSRS